MRPFLFGALLTPLSFLLVGCSPFASFNADTSASLSVATTNRGASLVSSATTGDVSISGLVRGIPLTIRSSGNSAGAVDSLNWDGVEYVNATDKGRMLQSASSFDNFGECFNPTEAGSRDDRANSSSQLLGRNVGPGEMATATQMAFWLPPQINYSPFHCGSTGLTTSQNSTVVSAHRFDKHIKIGAEGFDNVIDYTVGFSVTEAHSAVTFEALTGYMPTNFGVFFNYDPGSETLRLIPGNGSSSSSPVVVSTGDGKHAMGVLGPDFIRAGGGAGFAVFSSSLLGGGPAADTIKWNFTVAGGAIGPAIYSYRALLIVGSLSEVEATMRVLYRRFQPVLPVAPAGFKAVYRLNNGTDYLYSASSTEGTGEGYRLEGAAFTLAATAGPGLVLINRCLTRGSHSHHFLSADSACEGQLIDAPLGYMSPGVVPGRPLLHRKYNAQADIHLETVDSNEGAATGYREEGVLGSVW